MSSYSDDFNRADGGLGANWTKASSSNITGDLAISSNQAVGNVTNQWGVYTYASAASTNDQYAEAIVPIALSATMREVQIGVRVSLPILGAWWPDGYFIGIQYSSGGGINRYMFKYVGGNYYNIMSASSPAFTTGETIRIEAEGSAIRYIVNGATITTQVDTDITGASNRLLMIGCWGGSALDNFNAGDIGAAPVGQPTIKRFGGIPHMRRGQQAIW